MVAIWHPEEVLREGVRGTGKSLQLVLMSLKPGEEIAEKVERFDGRPTAWA
jgi:hypothetical protein